MKISFFSTQRYERPIFNQVNQLYHHEINYYDFHLNSESIGAVAPTDAICCFVNDSINAGVIDGLYERGVQLIALRSAGYNHVDYAYATKKRDKHMPRSILFTTGDCRTYSSPNFVSQ